MAATLRRAGRRGLAGRAGGRPDRAGTQVVARGAGGGSPAGAREPEPGARATAASRGLPAPGARGRPAAAGDPSPAGGYRLLAHLVGGTLPGLWAAGTRRTAEVAEQDEYLSPVESGPASLCPQSAGGAAARLLARGEPG